jgi:hypothetical protein
LISASTCAAAAASWAPVGLVELGAPPGADGQAVAGPVAGAPGRGDGDADAGRGDADAEGDGPVPGWPGTPVTATGGAARATPAGVAVHRLVAAAPHPGAVARELTAALPDAALAKSAPRAR